MKWLYKLFGKKTDDTTDVSEQTDNIEVATASDDGYVFDKLGEINEMLKSSKHCIIFFCNEDKPNMNNIIFYASDDDLDAEFELDVKDMLKQDIIQRVTPQEYDKELTHYDQDLANAFMEADYQIARADALEAELNYYKAINNPSGMDSNQALFLWNQVQEAKRALEKFGD